MSNQNEGNSFNHTNMTSVIPWYTPVSTITLVVLQRTSNLRVLILVEHCFPIFWSVTFHCVRKVQGDGVHKVYEFHYGLRRV